MIMARENRPPAIAVCLRAYVMYLSSCFMIANLRSTNSAVSCRFTSLSCLEPSDRQHFSLLSYIPDLTSLHLLLALLLHTFLDICEPSLLLLPLTTLTRQCHSGVKQSGLSLTKYHFASRRPCHMSLNTP